MRVTDEELKIFRRFLENDVPIEDFTNDRELDNIAADLQDARAERAAMPQYDWANMTIKDYLSAIVEHFDGEAAWNIEAIVEIEEFEQDGHKLAKVKGESRIYKQNNVGYVHQRTGYAEDDYYGWELIPLEGNVFVKISYQC